MLLCDDFCGNATLKCHLAIRVQNDEDSVEGLGGRKSSYVRGKIGTIEEDLRILYVHSLMDHSDVLTYSQAKVPSFV